MGVVGSNASTPIIMLLISLYYIFIFNNSFFPSRFMQMQLINEHVKNITVVYNHVNFIEQMDTFLTNKTI